MANRTALKELQTRLAARLQAARTEAVSVASWLALECAGRHWLVPLEQAGEIFAWTDVVAVPYAQPWFLGVANLRGALVGVIDLARLLDLPAARSEQALAESRLLQLGGALQVNAALLVDRLAGLRSAQDFAGEQPPPAGQAAYLGSIHTDAQGVPWQVIDMQALAGDARFLRIGL
ncbi:chemotaxis protein CheW [Comamonas faecalis]|uniref:Chemotaxis protein CheW n=1 Tax=Comamonas faecalis TaxID=1387849 RepID=A0ABP7QIU4_9BURK